MPSPEAPDDRYVLRERLGGDPTDEVYLALDRALGREVAYKVLTATDRPDRVARFLAEVQVTAGLEHPGVVRVHDVGLDGAGRPFFTMKRMRGRPWSQEIPGQTLFERLEVFQRVAEAIAYAHDRGVLHLDLRPGHVHVGAYGEVVVVEWGEALVKGDRERLTGRPPSAHAAPEVVEGRSGDLGPRADVYSLGRLLEECLSGRRGVAPELAAIAARAGAVRPGDRYPSVAGLLADLERWRGGFAVDALPLPWTRRLAKFLGRHPIPVAIAGTLAIALPAIALFVLDRAASGRAERLEAERARRLESQDSVAEAVEAGQAALAEAETLLGRDLPRPHAARVRLQLARTFLEQARTLGRSIEPDDDLEAILDLAAAAVGRSLLLEARTLWILASDPRFDDRAEHRRRGDVPADALAALAEARAAGVVGPEIDDLEGRIRGTGPFRIRTEPPDAGIAIHRLAADAVEPGELVATTDGRGAVLALDAGGYLVLVDHPDREACRLPIYLMRDEPRGRDLTAVLPRRDQVPAGFVHVLPGAFLAGDGCELRLIEEGYSISRTELTFGEWAEFSALLSPAQRPILVPNDGQRLDTQLLYEQGRPEDWRRIPALTLTAAHAEAYCRWRSASDPVFDYRLPTADEWERAARGADGRTYPWGDAWDPEMCNHAEHHEAFDPRRIIEPVDAGRWLGGRSVFGLLRTSGNAREWSSTRVDDRIVICGGQVSDIVEDCRASRRIELRQSTISLAYEGLRLVAVARE